MTSDIYPRVLFVLILNQENENYSLAMYNVSGEKAYTTSDLFMPHSTRDGFWRL